MGIERGALRALFLAGAAAVSATPAWAQNRGDATEESESAAPAAASPEIVVVGTRIEGAKTTGALPVTVLGEDRIAAVGSVSGDDLFRSIPQAGDVNFQEARTTGNLNDARGDNASLNLRSVGTGNTLVLVNGRRLILTPGTQTENFVPVQTANTNSLPVGAIRRLEVLRDGAGAIYGSDAVAGVVNVVIDDRFKGARLDARYGFADGTDEATLSAKFGAETKSGGRIMLFGSYNRRTPLMASERPFSASEDHRAALVGTPWEGDTAFDNRSTSSPWGSFLVVGSSAAVRQGTTALTTSGAFHVEPTANTAAGCSSTVYAGNLCLRSGGITGANSRVLRYDENPDRSIRGRLERINAYLTFKQPIGGAELFGEAGYYRAELGGQREQSAPVSSAVITVPATNYYNPFGATTIGGAANPNRLPNLTGVPAGGLALRLVNYRPVDTGPRTFVVTDEMIRGVLGLRGDWGAFNWETAATYARATTDDHTRNAISNTAFQAALARSTPDAYNPFHGGSQPDYSLGDGTPNAQATIDSFLVDVHRKGRTSLLTWDVRLSNPRLFGFLGGDVGMALGVEWRRETFRDDRDDRLDGTITYTDRVTGITYGSDILGASPSPDVSAHRNVIAGYAELAIPAVSPEMNVPLVQALDIQLAGRAEHYSDFGDVLKPKVAALWTVFDGLKFRSSWSKSFRAPNLPQFYSDGTQVSNTRTDYAYCRLNALTCSGVPTLEVRAGNDQLQPENTVNFSAGAVIQPRSWLTLTVDYWSIKSDGVIGIQGAQNQLLYDYLLRQQGSSNPNVVRLAPLAGQTVGDLQYVQDNYFNLGPRIIKGWDFGLTAQSGRTPWGRFTLDLNLAKLAKLEQSPSALQQLLIDANTAGKLGSGIIITSAGDLVKMNGNPRWRMQGDVTWKSGEFQAGVSASYVGKVFDTGPAAVAGRFYELPTMTTVNTYVQWKASRRSALDGLRLRAGARNLFDVMPPLYSSNYGFLGSLHSPTGRFVYFELGKDF